MTREARTNKSPNAASSPTGEQDAPLKEVILYAFGNVENALMGQFFGIIQLLMVVAMGMNPLIPALIISLKTIWDGVMDPIMAQITDNAKTRWGRRIPFILGGGLARITLLLLLIGLFPGTELLRSNTEMAREKEMEQAQAQLIPDLQTTADEQQTDAAEASAQETPSEADVRKMGFVQKVKEGFLVFFSVENKKHQLIAWYILIGSILMATLNTVNSVPYYALGIELCPSYDGRTNVVIWRSIADKFAGLMAPWVLPFCLLPIFRTAMDGMLWYGIFTAHIGVPSTIWMCVTVKERLKISIQKKDRVNVFQSIWQTARNPHFLRILALYVFIGFIMGIFLQFSKYLNIYWVFSGDVLAGASLGAMVETVAWALSIAILPIIHKLCKKTEKYRALRYAIVWMSIGAASQWFFVNPKWPYLQLLLPFFFSAGISSVFTILPSMMADVTDIDELKSGLRREAMFGAVMGFLIKMIVGIQPMIAGIVLVASGFNEDEKIQSPEVIMNMRLLLSFAPAALLMLALLLLWRYPLTRARMADVKEELVRRRAEKAALEEGAGS